MIGGPAFLVDPCRGPLVGETAVPGDKSIGHRAVMFAALADGAATVRGLSGGEDNRRTVQAFRALGVAIESLGPGALRIRGAGYAGLRAPTSSIDCGNSGTSIRLLSGVLAPRRFASVLVGDQYLHARPMGRVADPLRQMGAVIEGAVGPKAGDVYPPLRIGPLADGAALHGIDYASPIASAQVKSAILLAALGAEGPTTVTEPARSRDHTERMLAAMGAPLRVDGPRVTIEPADWDRRLAPRDFLVPGDLSSAAFLLGAALLVPGSAVTVRAVVLNPTRTGVLDALRAMGADLAITNERVEGGEPIGDVTARHGALRATRIDGELSVRAIDELPLLAALAVHAEGETIVADAQELRVKESDRIAAMATALRALGARIEERTDGWCIQGGGPLAGGRVESRGDHRIAMASAVTALVAQGPTRVDDVANVATSFPGFQDALRRLGASIADHTDA